MNDTTLRIVQHAAVAETRWFDEAMDETVNVRSGALLGPTLLDGNDRTTESVEIAADTKETRHI